MLTHVVFFKLKTFSPALATEMRDRIVAMKREINELVSIEAGVDVERSARSWDVCLIARFAVREHLAVYLAHPAHRAFGAWSLEHRESVCVVDYETP
jgi:hypothetical protein